MLIIGIITGLIILVFLVVVHELGHAIVAKRNGVVVEEFGIGFPPKAWAKKLKNGVLFSLNWLPIGGFVKLQGEHDSAKNKGDYGAASYWVKTKILLAGVAINWLVAALILTILAATGMPRILADQFTIPSDTTIVRGPVELTAVPTDRPAAQAGLQAGDVITALDGDTIASSQEFIEQSRAKKGQQVVIDYTRKGEVQQARVTLGQDVEKGVFGAGLGQRETSRSTWSAPIVGVTTTGQFTWATLQGLGTMLGNLGHGLVTQFSPDQATREQAGRELESVRDGVAGPVGILGTIFPNAQQAGPTQLAFLTAIISLTLAVMNALPIPALDGGRWWTMTIFRLIRKPLTKDKEETIQVIGFLVLMALIITITIADVTKLF